MKKKERKTIVSDAFRPLKNFTNVNIRILFCKKYVETETKWRQLFKMFKFKNAHKYT